MGTSINQRINGMHSITVRLSIYHACKSMDKWGTDMGSPAGKIFSCGDLIYNHRKLHNCALSCPWVGELGLPPPVEGTRQPTYHPDGRPHQQRTGKLLESFTVLRPCVLRSLKLDLCWTPTTNNCATLSDPHSSRLFCPLVMDLKAATCPLRIDYMPEALFPPGNRFCIPTL